MEETIHFLAIIKRNPNGSKPMKSWLDIKGYEGVYQVSNDGEVKRVSQSAGSVAGRLLKSRTTKSGYLDVVLSANGVAKHHAVHRLVATAFVPNPNPDLCIDVNHINGIKNDNNHLNLEWVTTSENLKHGYRVLGRQSYIQGAIKPKLTESDVKEIRHLLATTTLTQKAIGTKFGVNDRLVSAIKNNKIWKDVV